MGPTNDTVSIRINRNRDREMTQQLQEHTPCSFWFFQIRLLCVLAVLCRPVWPWAQRSSCLCLYLCLPMLALEAHVITARLFVFWDRVSLYITSWLGTQRYTCLCLLCAGIRGVWLSFTFLVMCTCVYAKVCACECRSFQWPQEGVGYFRVVVQVTVNHLTWELRSKCESSIRVLCSEPARWC